MVKIFACLDLDQTSSFMDGHKLTFCNIIILFLLIVFIFHGVAVAQEHKIMEHEITEHKITGKSLTIHPEKQFNFSEISYSNEEYFRAIGEYKRYIYFFPEGNMVEMAMFRIGMSFFKMKRFKEAIKSFKAVVDKYRDTDIAVKSYFMITKCHLNRKEFGPAVSNLQNLIIITGDADIKDEAYYRTGWIYIEMGAWEKARVTLEKVSTQNRDKYRLKRLSIELDQEKSIPKKSPSIAGVLSIFPGAGYLYCERYHDGLIAFLLNAGLMYAAYESFDNDLYALGGVIALVESGFYSGSIYGSITSAHKYNRTKTRHFIKQLKENMRVNLSAGEKNESIMLTFQYHF